MIFLFPSAGEIENMLLASKIAAAERRRQIELERWHRQKAMDEYRRHADQGIIEGECEHVDDPLSLPLIEVNNNGD